jgi:hypothetical protein
MERCSWLSRTFDTCPTRSEGRANTFRACLGKSFPCPNQTLNPRVQAHNGDAATACCPEEGYPEVPWLFPPMLSRCIFRVGTSFQQQCIHSIKFIIFRSWSCQASAELRLISQKPGIPNFIRKTNHIYTSKENDWGYSCFMTWAVRYQI